MTDKEFKERLLKTEYTLEDFDKGNITNDYIATKCLLNYYNYTINKYIGYYDIIDIHSTDKGRLLITVDKNKLSVCIDTLTELKSVLKNVKVGHFIPYNTSIYNDIINSLHYTINLLDSIISDITIENFVIVLMDLHKSNIDLYGKIMQQLIKLIQNKLKYEDNCTPIHSKRMIITPNKEK